MSTDDWASGKSDERILWVVSIGGIEKVGEGTIGWRYINEICESAYEHLLCFVACNGGGKHFPVGFGVCMPSVKWYTVFQGFSGVEGALHVVNGLRYKTKA